jgi:hypothetical protein
MKSARNLIDWSFKQIVLLWIVAMAFQVVLIVLPGLSPRARAARAASRVGSLKVSGRPAADPGTPPKLTPSKRASYVTTAGDSIYEMITLARADSQARGLPRRTNGIGFYLFIFAVAGTIPTGLLLITAVWAFGQLIKRFVPALDSPSLPSTPQP